MVLSSRWVFTLNNYSQNEVDALVALGQDDETRYLCFGREIGESGTPHLQGFWITKKNSTSHRQARGFIGFRAFVEKARGTDLQASNYCKKDGDFEEFGELPQGCRGRRTDWTHFREYVANEPGPITDRQLFREFPGLYARYRDNLHEFIRLIRDPIIIGSGELRPGWQQCTHDILLEEPNDRDVRIILDHDGNSGKSWFCRYMLEKYPDKVQILRTGKRDDVAHVIDETKSIFLFDIPRSQMEFFQWSVPEMLKDRMVFSPKYASRMKILSSTPHVCIMCNELPEDIPLSQDRIKIGRASCRERV